MTLQPPDNPNPFPDPAPGGIGARLANGTAWVFAELLRHLGEPIAAWQSFWINAAAQVAADEALAAYDNIEISEDIVPLAGPPFARMGALVRSFPAWGQVFALLTIIATLSREFALMAAKRITSALGYQINRAVPTFRISAEDGLIAERRGAQLPQDLMLDLADEGVDAARGEALIQKSYRWVSIVEIRDLYWRGFNAQDETRRLLRGVGLPDDQVELMLTLWTPTATSISGNPGGGQSSGEGFGGYVPGVSDLTRFAIRDVFNPQYRESLLTPEPGEDYYAWAAAQGMSHAVAQMYWAAHWKIPERGEAFRAWHRLGNGGHNGIEFTREDLVGLLRRDDWLSQYYDVTIEASWAAPSAFLIRGMVESGAISDDMARSMLEWSQYRPDYVDSIMDWIHLAKHQKNKDLTSSNITTAYKDRLLSRDEAAANLAAIGYDVDEAELVLAIADHDLSKSTRTARQNAVKARFLHGRITEEDAIESLLAIGLGDEQVTALLDQWDAEKHTTAPHLTLAELRSLYVDGVLGAPDFEARVGALGYPEQEVEWLIDQADAQASEALGRKTRAQLTRDRQAHPKPSRADLSAWLHATLITPAQFTAALLEMGYSQESINRYAAKAQIQTVTPPYKTDQAEAAIATAREQFRRGVIDRAALPRALQAAGMPAALAREITSYETARLTAPPLRPPAAPIPIYKTPAGKLELATALRQFRAGTITSVQLHAELIALQEPEALAAATIRNELAKIPTPA